MPDRQLYVDVPMAQNVGGSYHQPGLSGRSESASVAMTSTHDHGIGQRITAFFSGQGST